MRAEGVAELAPLKLESAPLRNKIIASLRRAIEIGVLAPGDRLVEKDLCAQLNVSRTSLREALRELEAKGVLTQQNRGLVVAGITRHDAENIYRIRAMLEALLAQQFIERAGDEDLEELIRESKRLRQAYASHDLENILEAKKRFYDCFCAGAQNPLAFDILSRLTLQTSQLRSVSLSRLERQEQSISEIEELVAAIKRRDVAVAMEAARRHVENAAASALSSTNAKDVLDKG